MRLSKNEFGSPVSVHTCKACGDEFTVCPPASSDWDGCLAPVCDSYDPDRDVDRYFDSNVEPIHGVLFGPAKCRHGFTEAGQAFESTTVPGLWIYQCECGDTVRGPKPIVLHKHAKRLLSCPDCGEPECECGKGVDR